MAGMSATGPRTAGQTWALAIGIVYLLVGVVGLFVAGSFTGGTADDKLILFRLNHLHNIVHLGLGAVWIWVSRSAALSKSVNLILGIVLLVVALLGFVATGLTHTLLNIDSASDPDNFLHLITGAVALYFGTAGARTTAARTV